MISLFSKSIGASMAMAALLVLSACGGGGSSSTGVGGGSGGTTGVSPDAIQVNLSGVQIESRRELPSTVQIAGYRLFVVGQ